MSPIAVVLFPGQGAQSVGMLDSFLDADLDEQVASVFESCERVLGYDLAALCQKATSEDLADTRVAQPAMYTAGYLSFLGLQRAHPEFFSGDAADDVRVRFAGFSLGEYTALAASGLVSFEDGLRLVQARAQAMSKCSGGGMVTVIGLEANELQAILDQYTDEENKNHVLSIANHLFPRAFVVAGDAKAVEWLPDQLPAKCRCVRAKVSGAFHTAAMNDAADELRQALATTEVTTASKSDKVSLFSNVTGVPYAQLDQAAVTNALLDQMVSAVQWDTILRGVVAHDPTEELHLFELGPGKQLGSMFRRVHPKLAKHLKHFESAGVIGLMPVSPAVAEYVDEDDQIETKDEEVEMKLRATPAPVAPARPVSANRPRYSLKKCPSSTHNIVLLKSKAPYPRTYSDLQSSFKRFSGSWRADSSPGCLHRRASAAPATS
jgi:[acyl-carrier-protein] S-malonyltransferase